MAPDHHGSTCSGVSAGGSATLRNHDARSPGTGPGASGQSPAADQVLDFFCQNILKHGFVQTKVSHQPLELLVLLFKLPQLA